MKLLYFSWLREKIGVAEEDVSPPDSVRSVADLLHWLQGRGGGYADALKDLSLVRVAVNQEYVKFEETVVAADEVALFPPVTGG
ncbi:MAG: molybdopterin converting factor subunit 1 [Rhodospirillales bacterium]